MTEQPNMKIALLLFYNSKVGGIVTVHNNIMYALRKLGYQVDEFYITSNKRLLGKCPFSYIDRDIKVLGFSTPEMRSQYKNIIGQYDLLIFSHPCPSLTKSFSNTDWKSCYLPDKKIVTYFHDPFWNKYYPWINDVFDKINLFVAIQETAFNSLPANINKKLVRHPMVIDDIGLYDDNKEDLIIQTNHFKSWKHNELIIKVKHKIAAMLEVYGCGLEYHYMSGTKRKDTYKDNGEWIWERALANGMKYKGQVSFDKVFEAYKRAKILVDMSTGMDKGKCTIMNYSVLEGIKYGCVPVIRKYSCQAPFTAENFVIIDEDNLEADLANKSNMVISDFSNYAKMREANIKILRENFDCVQHVKTVLAEVK